jgi:hypothetical protein
MSRPPLNVRISLDDVRCYDAGDGFFSAEPYLWTVFFKLDGDSLILGDDSFLHGTCTVFPTPGSHGNLGDTDVDDGDDVIVPRAVGEFLGTLNPIPSEEAIAPLAPDGGAFVGVVAVLMEQDQFSDAGAEAGHARLNRFIERAINDLILPVGVAPNFPDDVGKKLGFRKKDVSPEDIKRFAEEAEDTIKSAVFAAQGFLDDLLTIVDRDNKLGVSVLIYKYEDLLDNYWDISERFQNVLNTPNGQVIDGDWRIMGEAQGVHPNLGGHVHLRRSEDYGTPAAAGAPSTCLVPFAGTHNIIYRDTDGHLHELWSTLGGETGTTDVTNNAHAPTAAGNPYTYVDTTAGLELVLYRSDDGGIHSLYWSTGDAGHDDLTGPIGAPGAAGDPVGIFNPATNIHHVIYRGDHGHLHVLWWSGGDPDQHADLHDSIVPPVAPAPPAAGDPSAYLDPARGDNVVVYRGTDQQIHSLYWSDGPVGHDALSAFVGTPPAAGDPVGYYIPGLDTHQITYRSVDGHLYEIWSAGIAAAQAWDVTAAAGAPPASADPAVCYNAATNTKHVIYLGPFGHLFDIHWVPGGPPSCVDLTLAGLAHRATTDRPAAVVDGLGMLHVAYHGTDNQVHETRSPANQTDWRWCNKCQGLYFGGGVASSQCPAGGAHAAPAQSGSAEYGVALNIGAAANHQPDWRWCSKCQGLFYAGLAPSPCPAGGTHAAPAESGSANYSLAYAVTEEANRQSDWRYCDKCHGLFYGSGLAASRCPVGGTHAAPAESGSANYSLPYLVKSIVPSDGHWTLPDAAHDLHPTDAVIHF